MDYESFRFNSLNDGMSIQGYRWEVSAPRAIMVISHGAAEHALRYGRFAEALAAAGVETWSNDHRGHGQSPGPDGLGDFGEGGWDALVEDMHQLVQMAHAKYPGTPLFLFGHSMGSMSAQQYVLDHSADVDALILSGSTARERPKPGEEPTPRGPVDRTFEGRTRYDWLSRDQAEVDKYIEDPLCGFESRRSNRGSAMGRQRLADPANFKSIRGDLPCLFVAGDRDPINNNLKGMKLLEQYFHDAGIARVDTLYYEGGRHEMLNETNRDEVTADIVAWVEDVLNG